LAYLAGYGVQALIVAQDRSQIFGRYGKDESITANCHVRIAFAPNDLSTAQWLSSMCGSTTRIHTNVRESGKRRDFRLSGLSKDISHTKRALLTPEEVMRLPGLRKDRSGNVVAPGEMLCFVGASFPFRLQQAPYFIDRHLRNRFYYNTGEQQCLNA
jgi:type IV secretion system protein VirD4